VTDGNGNTTSYVHDELHRLEQITYADVGAGQKSRYFDWTCCGLDQVTDENGRITKFVYEDDTNWLWKVIEDYGGLGYTTEYGYDEVGNVVSVKNARGKTRTFTYDDADRLVRADYPDATYETWTLRDDGRVYQHRDGRGRVTTYRYDADDRLAGSGSYVAINYPNSTDVQVVRDDDGLVTSFTDESGTSSIVYYPSGWVKLFTDGPGKTVTYDYTGVGDVYQMWTPSSSTPFTYSYNARNQLASVVNPDSQTISFTYDNGGRLARMDRPGGYTTWNWDARDWLNEVRSRNSGGVDLYRAYYYRWSGSTWDHVGNSLKKAEWFLGVPNYYWTYYWYDGVYRLTQDARKHRNDTAFREHYLYAYDQVGNRTRFQDLIAGTDHYYTYDDNDKLTKIGTTAGGSDLSTFGYDGAGNMTSVAGSLLGARTLVYDDESRLVQNNYPKAGGGTWYDRYYYTALGQRYRSRLQAAWSRYIYHGDRVLEQTNDSGGMLARYTLASGSYFAPMLHLKRSTGESRFPMYDAVGTARALVDDTATVTDTYSLDAFGAEFAAATGSTPNPYRYVGASGYITDPSGLQQLGARFYWPELGRFLQQDPIGDGMNWYAYAGNNPVVWIDPEGLHQTESMWHNLGHWDCTWVPGLKQGGAILADTVNVLGNPYMDAGAYDPTDPYIGAARVSGSRRGRRR
jgi:RHS repeat-associated protein